VSWAKKTQLLPALDGLFLCFKAANNTHRLIQKYSINLSIGLAVLSRSSWRLHGLSGDREGVLAVTVQANWRLTFRFVGQDVELLDDLDYH
jgi:proteic killer suppression protein